MEEIHAIEMVRRIRDTLYEATRNMSREELKAHFRHEAQRSEAAVASLLTSRHVGSPQERHPRSGNAAHAGLE